MCMSARICIAGDRARRSAKHGVASAAGVAQAQARRSRRGSRARPAKGADVALRALLQQSQDAQLEIQPSP